MKRKDAKHPPRNHAAAGKPPIRIRTVPADRPLTVGWIACVVMTVLLLLVLGRVVQLQVHPPRAVVELLDTQQSRTTLLARRGSLMDRHGRPIATTRVARRLFVDPLLVEEPGTFSEQVGYLLNYDPAWVEMMISKRPDSRYVVLDHRLTDTRINQFDSNRVPGLYAEPVLVRDYPLGSLAGQVVGFVSRDGRGLDGLERTLEPELSPEPGAIRYWRDARRRPIWVDQDAYRLPSDGRNLRLSIDTVIQSIAEAQLNATCAQYRAPAGQIVVMQPYTGEILAMANYPAFDPNIFNVSPDDMRRNRAVTDVFEPGSTFKPFIWAAATEMGYAHPDEKIDCTTNGFYVSPQGRRLRDVHGAGVVTWDQVLVKSSNIGMAIVGQRMGAKPMHDVVRAFGFGAPTGSGLPGEVSGIVNPLRRWNHYSVTSVPMGQEVAVTSIQLARAFCVFANGGLMVHPTILARDPEDPRNQVPILERLLSPATAAHTRQVMRQVMTEGTGRRGNLTGYPIFGKTGTAQVADREKGGYLQGHYTAVFVGGAPVDNPQIVVTATIHIDDAKQGYYGGVVAAPAAAAVIDHTLQYLGVPRHADPPKKRTALR